MSVKIWSLTVGRDSGWSAVTPCGLITAERGVTVTILIGETWEQTLDAVKTLRDPPAETKPDE